MENAKRKKVLVAVDSFKESMSSCEINEVIKNQIEQSFSQYSVETVTISDGGEGTLDSIYHSIGGTYEDIESVDSLNRKIFVKYLTSIVDGVKTAFIESAKIIGIDLVTISEQSFAQGSSYGLGLVILDAIKKENKRIIVFLGGTATGDGGLGLLSALGYKVESGNYGNQLLGFKRILSVNSQELFRDVDLIVATDVDSTLGGKINSFTQYNSQKGSTSEQDAIINCCTKKYIKNINNLSEIDISKIPGTGAAGGLGGALVLLGATIVNGFDLIKKIVNLSKKIEDADLIITGEGKIDSQTQNGKVPFALAKLAKSLNIPIIAICGRNALSPEELKDSLFNGVFSIQSEPITLEEALEIEYAEMNIQKMIVAIMKMISCTIV